MNCKPGTFGRINSNARRLNNVGVYVEVLRPYVEGETLPGHSAPYRTGGELGWVVQGISGPLEVPSGRSNVHVARDHVITPFDGSTDNEKFVVESRKSLPRKKPVTGPVTINERGEPA